MNTRLFIQMKKQLLLAERARIIGQVSSLPEGSLQIQQNKSRFKWYRIIRSENQAVKKEYIPKSARKLAEQLALKAQLENHLSAINKKLLIIEYFLNNYPDSDPDAFRSIFLKEEYTELLRASNLLSASAIDAWISEDFEHSPEHPEFLKVPTKAGILVRSKSEALIANELYDQGIPFRYEQALYLGDMKIYPDFVIPDPANPQIITVWEHFGLMDSPPYVSNVKVKMGAYLESHFIPGQNLILTYECKDKPLDINYVSLLVAYHFS